MFNIIDALERALAAPSAKLFHGLEQLQLRLVGIREQAGITNAHLAELTQAQERTNELLAQILMERTMTLEDS